jgi:hypothetical protein
MAMLANVICLIAVAVASAHQVIPPRPNISSSFSIKADIVEYEDNILSGSGTGKICQLSANNSTQKFFTQFYMIIIDPIHPSVTPTIETTLDRYDMKMQYGTSCTYDDDGNPNCTCSGNTIDSDQYSGLWAWVSNASYAGQEDMFDQKVNLWQALIVSPGVGAFYTVGVTESDPNIPIMFEIGVFAAYDSTYNMSFLISEFDPSPPNDVVFEIPKNCSNSTIVDGILDSNHKRRIQTPIHYTRFLSCCLVASVSLLVFLFISSY